MARTVRLVSLVCVNCGISFTRNAHWVQNPDRTVCTRYCNGTVPTPLGPSTKIAILTCSNPNCGALFVRKAKDIRRDPEHTCCSKKCAGRPPGNSAGVKIAYFNCEQCGKLFVRRVKRITKGAEHVVCSNKCRDDLRRTFPAIIPCDYCGKLFKSTLSQYLRSRRRYCRMECFEADRETPPPPLQLTPEDVLRRKRYLASARIAAHRARARRRHAPVNDFTPAQWREMQQVFHHRCVYCPADCKACRNKTHLLTPDHLTPFAKGGSNTKANIVPSCLKCNIKKNDGPVLKPVQPLLL